MILYHMSQTLKLGDEMKPDYQKNRLYSKSSG